MELVAFVSCIYNFKTRCLNFTVDTKVLCICIDQDSNAVILGCIWAHVRALSRLVFHHLSQVLSLGLWFGAICCVKVFFYRNKGSIFI